MLTYILDSWSIHKILGHGYSSGSIGSLIDSRNFWVLFTKHRAPHASTMKSRQYSGPIGYLSVRVKTHRMQNSDEDVCLVAWMCVWAKHRSCKTSTPSKPVGYGRKVRSSRSRLHLFTQHDPPFPHLHPLVLGFLIHNRYCRGQTLPYPFTLELSRLLSPSSSTYHVSTRPEAFAPSLSLATISHTLHSSRCWGMLLLGFIKGIMRFDIPSFHLPLATSSSSDLVAHLVRLDLRMLSTIGICGRVYPVFLVFMRWLCLDMLRSSPRLDCRN